MPPAVCAADDRVVRPVPVTSGRVVTELHVSPSLLVQIAALLGADPRHRLPNVPVYAVKYDSVVPSTLYAGTELGVYTSVDDGMTWDRLGYGLPIVPVRDLFVSGNRHFIRIATYGRGFWELRLNR